MRLESANTRAISTNVNAGSTSLKASLGQGARGEQGLPGNASAAWTPATAVTTGTVRQAPDGSWIKSTASRTTRASFDSTEAAWWTATLATAGTLEATALSATTAQLKVWAKNPDNLVAGALTYDSNGLLTGAVVEWPDGLPGVLAITSRQTDTGAVLGYTITRVNGATTTTYTQPTITRDSSGVATLVPQIVVS